jgi:NADH-quinone oxidoreductase subunit L
LTPSLHLWLIPALPLAGFLINGLAGRRLPKSALNAVALGSVLLAFLWTLRVFAATQGLTSPHVERYFTWIASGTLHVDCSFYVDRLTLLMLLVVTGVGTIIHFYSVGYMAHEGGYYRFFAYLNLFMFFMLVLVLAANYLLMFVGWEGVGLTSYLLIGFWFRKRSATDAGNKAFLVNRIGDFGFSLGLFLMFIAFRSFDFQTVLPQAAGVAPVTLTAIALLLFVGATGKSAQLPLYVWLPDAMEGPTPVSALIHAATMVTAGVYMVARSAPLFVRSALAMDVVAVVGLVTALFAATIGLLQTDIKKVLAYSTISQLGYMFLALGCGGFGAGIFHLMTHAFFKGLLFLAAGSVIHAMSGEQDMRKMGALAGKIPLTCATFVIGALALAGVPPLAGFFSKDEILLHAYERSPVLYALGIFTAFLTAFYIFRAVFLTFLGTSRRSEEADHHLHESPAIMTVPLVVLAALSAGGGFLAIDRWLTPVFAGVTQEARIVHGFETALMALSVAAGLAGIALSYLLYISRPQWSDDLADAAGELHRFILNKYYVDEIYGAVIVRPLLVISSHFLWQVLDAGVIDGAVNLTGREATGTGRILRRIQSGNLRSYATWVLLGAVTVVAVMGAWLAR